MKPSEFEVATMERDYAEIRQTCGLPRDLVGRLLTIYWKPDDGESALLMRSEVRIKSTLCRDDGIYILYLESGDFEYILQSGKDWTARRKTDTVTQQKYDSGKLDDATQTALNPEVVVIGL